MCGNQLRSRGRIYRQGLSQENGKQEREEEREEEGDKKGEGEAEGDCNLWHVTYHTERGFLTITLLL